MDNIEIEKIIRAKRKSVSLQITDDATLIIKVPRGIKDKEIENIISKHKDWINKKIKKIRERKTKYIPKKFITGEKFLFLGKYYELRTVETKKNELKFENNCFFISDSTYDIKKRLFIDWYKRKGYKIISERVKYFERKYNFGFNKIKITGAKKRWGSCSPTGNLNFSWRLIMAPYEIIDYVIVHELSHIEHKNHSKLFWKYVESIVPDYKNRENWLKENGYLLKL